METLNALTIPLNISALIEASAGTGKTYTIANLFVRLLLKDEDNRKPLNINEILVVTFTTLATQELRDRIRKRLAEVAKLFGDYKSGKSTALEQDQAFLFPLYQKVIEQDPDLSETLLRLSIAEKEIDLANIFTIDSFCQKMLFQFAFDSGVPFDIELNPDENELVTRLNHEMWREQCYPLKQEYAKVIYQGYKTPDKLLWKIKPYLYQNLPENNQLITAHSLNDLFDILNQHIQKIKKQWQQNQQEIIRFLQQEENLNRRSYRSDLILKWAEQVSEWADSTTLAIPENFSRFCQRGLDNPKARKNAEQPIENTIFAENETALTVYEQQFGSIYHCLEYHFLNQLRQKLAQYKLTHKDRTFKDIQILFNQALKSTQGESLINQIQNLYQFAMIDEFQDTDQDQYEIFSQLFMNQSAQQKQIGFIMIGDPKQSIYKFRGADIFTYLIAKENAKKSYTLNKNWRSLPAVVESTNQLFTFNQDSEPFLYRGITFEPVEFNQTDTKLVGESSTNFYQQSEFNLELAAEQCAYQIQQQLKKSSEEKFFLSFSNKESQPIQPEDICVLVRDRNQADLIKEMLKKYHIDAVISNNKNIIFATNEAKNLLTLLKACLEPFNARAILTTLGTTLWSKAANEIYQLKNNEAEWDLWVTKFIEYKQIWQQQGILPMLHHIFREENILQQLKNTTENSERIITNLFHLAELLQQATLQLENEITLLRWLEENINNPQGSEEQLLRLENERKLVKIITIHSSKGLEYPIVWLPFIAKKAKVSNQNFSIDNFSLYRDFEKNENRWAFENKEKATEAIIKEELAEDLRLLYVAITRAKYQINFILPKNFEKGWNALHYLLSNGEIELDIKYQSDLTLEDYLTKKGIPLENIIELPDNPSPDNWQPIQIEKTIVPLEFSGNIPRYTGRITSFTQLESQSRDLQKNNKILPLVDNAFDYDTHLNEQENNGLNIENEYSPIKFPSSNKVGNLLHKFFESTSFNQSISIEKVAKLCEQLDLNENWIEPTKQWFENIMQTPFADPTFSLNQIDEKQRLNEWQFYLRLSNPNALPELNKLLKKHSPISKNLPDLNLLELEGFIKGYVDCIVKIYDKFYILDYKSNALSAFGYDFSQQNIEKEIGKSRYDLQYILYTLAIHRYLKFRLGNNYDYDKDFGGIAYLFLRGMNGTSNSGVYFEKPSKQLIEEMDLLFD